MQPERPVCPEARTLLQQHWGYPDFLPLDVYDLDALHRGEKKLRTITKRASSMTSSSRQSFAAQGRLTATCS